jgi:hypothetical protein
MDKFKPSIIVGHFGSYQAAYNAVGSRFKKSGKFSIQMANEKKDHPFTLIYYGNFLI